MTPLFVYMCHHPVAMNHVNLWYNRPWCKFTQENHPASDAFARLVLIRTIVTDNGTQIISGKLQDFLIIKKILQINFNNNNKYFSCSQSLKTYEIWKCIFFAKLTFFESTLLSFRTIDSLKIKSGARIILLVHILTDCM